MFVDFEQSTFYFAIMLRIYLCLLLKEAAPYVTGIFLFWGEFMDDKIIEWAEKSSIYMKYKHFDSRIAIKDVIDTVSNPEYIKKHAFMPFLHKKLEQHKYSKTKGRYTKERKLYYSSHFDRCVYQYYSYLLNEQYNKLIREQKIQDVAIAYRSDLHKSNVNFAKEAFDFIRRHPECIVIIGDFTDFFDTLAHLYLKKQLCKVLNVDTLPDDYYKIYRSITKYAYAEPDEIESLIKEHDIKVSNKLLIPIAELRKHKNIIHCNKNAYGIPQGSAISAVMSNVYMINFDKACKSFATKYNGIYRRYSDDTIFIIPKSKTMNVANIYDSIQSIVKKTPNLKLSPEKTKAFIFKNGQVFNQGVVIGNTNYDKDFIDYLGFTFDGKRIKLRDKTIGKYYYRAYQKADTIRRNNTSPKRKKVYGKYNLYKVYSAKGLKDGGKNFISYVQRCERVFGKEENVTRILQTHYGKIKQRLKKPR